MTRTYWRGDRLYFDKDRDDFDTTLERGVNQYGQPVVLCGLQMYMRLLWEPDPDEWYEQQAALLSERAPA